MRFDRRNDSILRPLDFQAPKLSLEKEMSYKPKVCTIMDEFSFNSFKDYFDLVIWTFKNWQNQLNHLTTFSY